jgi:Xaa-Pro aminopeptidase
MKAELDELMKAEGIDAILVTGAGDHNPAMVYLTGGGHFRGDCIKVSGQPPVLFHWPMEREEASCTGLITRSYADYPCRRFLTQAGGDRPTAMALQYQHMLADLGITSGHLALYGNTELGQSFAIFTKLQRLVPDLVLDTPAEGDILGHARMTKDAGEVERIRKIGKITTRVVADTADFLTKEAVKDNVLVKQDGSPLTIGDVKSRIRLQLTELGAEAPEGFIFSIGRDAGIPHSGGNDADLLRLGQTIVFDIYPCEAGGGYFYDFTRTWCLGYAPEPVLRSYNQVKEVYSTIVSELELGQDFSHYQKRASALFRKMGHATPEDSPSVQEGYVHGLGHGVGLEVQERPISSMRALQHEPLLPGSVITIEPGLYYPEQGFGVRLENTLWASPRGRFEVLADYPLDLILPVQN